MGRLNKKLQQKERKKLGGSAISKSAVLATLADRDKKKSETSILTIVKVLNSGSAHPSILSHFVVTLTSLLMQ